MKIEEALKFLNDFVACSKSVFGEIDITPIGPMDAANFPDEIPKLNNNIDGMYIIWSKNDRRIIYVGIANDIPRRIYQHIGKGFSWKRGNSIANFPNCTLAEGRSWLKKTTQQELKNAEWNITAILHSPEYLKGLLESALIFWGLKNDKKLEINVDL